MKYSYNLDTKGIIFAGSHDINASFKDLCAVCDAIRYRSISSALEVLDGVISSNRPIEYRRHNKYMGSRKELGGKKGRYPVKCAKIVKKVVVNASANAVNKGENPDFMYVVHATANKTTIIPRSPPKGIRAHSGGYGYGTIRRSNLEYAKVEIGIADKEVNGLGSRMKRAIKAMDRERKAAEKTKQKKEKPRQKTPKPLSAPVAKDTKEAKDTKKEAKGAKETKQPEQHTPAQSTPAKDASTSQSKRPEPNVTGPAKKENANNEEKDKV